MSWLSSLHGRGKGPTPPPVHQDQTGQIAEFFQDLGGTAQVPKTFDDAIEALLDTGRVAIIDWADSPNMVLENLGALLQGKNALAASDTNAVLAAGENAGKTGRGAAALPTLHALDQTLNGSGERLLWIDRGGDIFEIARVPDAIWSKWHDVKLGDLFVLEANINNDLPKNRTFTAGPK